MAQTVASAINNEETFDKDSVSRDFQTAIAQALNDLSTTSENLQVIVSEITRVFLLFNSLYPEICFFFRENIVERC